MNHTPSILWRSCAFLLMAGLLSGSAQTAFANSPGAAGLLAVQSAYSESKPPYEVVPETFSLTLQDGTDWLPASAAGQARRVADLKESDDETSWRYPDEQVSVQIKAVDDYLSVTITADTSLNQAFAWPIVTSDRYYLPLGEGKRVPADDPVWRDYLNERELDVLEQLSMPFWAAEYADSAVLFILENPFRTSLHFDSDPRLAFTVNHEYPAIGETRSNRFRIYLTDNDPVAIAKTYKKYVTETSGFVTLEQKAQRNPDIRKLYGAPFIYLWGERVLEPEDVNWPAFRKAADSPVMDYLLSLDSGSESGRDFTYVLSEIKTQDYVAAYQKNVVCGHLSSLLKRDDFYDPAVLTKSNPTLDALVGEGYEGLTSANRVKANSHALSENLPGVFQAVGTWYDENTVGLIEGLKQSGIERAWIGLNSWEQAYAKPALVEKAADEGYLIGSYDSYHSIHEPGKEQWITAAFEDPALYEEATVADESGKKISGFQGVGRKLNPTLSLPAVKSRMSRIMENGLPFNSWFIDCDATGEIHDDYTEQHVTGQEADLQARLERMAYIRDTYNLVVGSEGGHDFAASTIAFAHGIELKSFSWMDPDMKEN